MFDIISLRIRSMHKNSKIMDLRKLPSFSNQNSVKLHKLVPYMVKQIYFPNNYYNTTGSGSKLYSDCMDSFEGVDSKLISDFSRDSIDRMYETRSPTDISRNDSTSSFGNSMNNTWKNNNQDDNNFKE